MSFDGIIHEDNSKTNKPKQDINQNKKPHARDFGWIRGGKRDPR